jgi:all-trans-retinol 13,14-reductase
MKQYDVLIVGSGLGGLLSGYILSKEGYSVCIAEKNAEIGGCLQSFSRNGCIFDTGIHYIGSMEKDQILHRYFKYFGLTDKLRLKKMDEGGFDVINLASNGTAYKFAMGADRFVDTLHQKFPQERNSLNAYMKKVQDINGSLNLINLREVDTNNLIDSEYITVNTSDFIRSVTSDRTLQQVLAGNNSIYAGDATKTPLYMHALIQNFFIESAWRFVDGSSQLADILAEGIIERGGEILRGYEAKQFVFEGNDLKYVDFANGERLQAKYFISNIHPATTLNMVHSHRIKKAYRNRINNLENTPSTFSVYAVLKRDTFPYINANHYYHNSDDVWGTAQYTEQEWPKGFMLLTPAGSNCDRYADGLIMMTYMNFADVEKWSDTTIEERGGDYRAFKNAKAERLLDEVGKIFPGIRNQIQTYYTSTPLTYRDYTGTVNGSIYGVVRDCNNPVESYIPPRTKIPNLFFTGQNINMHGVLGVTIGSILTCAEFVGLNYLIKRINEAA